MRQLECLDDDSILTLTDVCFHCIYIYIYIYIYSLQNRSPLKVMFLSANAGGGHRASAASLEAQFQNHFPGSECLTLELEQIMNTWPYSQIANSYKGLTSNPSLWRMI